MDYSLLPGRVAGFSDNVDLIPLDARYGLRQAITLLLSRSRDPNLLALAAKCRMYGVRKSEMPS